MIRSFADKGTEQFWKAGKGRRVPSQLQARAVTKLAVLDAATDLRDLELPPGNHLEPLRGDREGQHNIRINHQYRVCFRWENGDVYEVELSKHYE